MREIIIALIILRSMHAYIINNALYERGMFIMDAGELVFQYHSYLPLRQLNTHE